MKALIISGTSRKNNYSDRVADALSRHLEDHETGKFKLSERTVPMMSERAKNQVEPPEDVEFFQESVQWSDIVIPVIPEYNHGLPGPFKNLFDYLYEDYEDKTFSPVTVSAGGFGGVRAMSHLNDVLLAVEADIGPGLHVSRVRENFDPVTDEYEARIQEFITDIENYF